MDAPFTFFHSCPGAARAVGLPPPCAPLATVEYAGRSGLAVAIVVAGDVRRAEALVEDLRLFLTVGAEGGSPDTASVGLPVCMAFPELREGGETEPENFDTACDRLAVLQALQAATDSPPARRPAVFVVTTPAALLQPVPPPAVLRERGFRLVRGQRIAHGEVVARLRALDYDGEALCEAPGQYAVRGGIVDVYPITGDRPYRLDFLGDEIEDVRAFDPVTQRSGEPAATVDLAPPPGALAGGGAGHLRDHAGAAVHWIVIEPRDVAAAATEAAAGTAPSPELALPIRPGDLLTEISDLDLGEAGAPEPAAWDAEPLSAFRTLAEESRLADERLMEEQTRRAKFFDLLAQWNRSGERILVVLPNPGERDRVSELLGEHPALAGFRPRFATGPLDEGFRLVFREGHERPSWPWLNGAAGLVVVSETEIFGVRRRRRPRGRAKAAVNQSQVDQLLDFAELVEGEFVVHLQHGIAVYRGVTVLETHGERREVLTLEFDDGVLLHVPLQESHLVSRYVGLTKVKPRLGRIGSGRWEKIRSAAERATLDYAAHLLATQARRTLDPGFAFPPDHAWQREFEATFSYRETPDQMRAIADVKADMEQPRPMDRLVCGDVGFGKTEVALRAAFKAVMGGRQVAVLAPTTVLAQQHFNTFRERTSGFPVVIEMVSRFRTRSEQTRILDAVAAGRVDILVGTHRLVQSDVRFKNLGLVVVDEEQRFGVRHKEVFKEWRAGVDMLAMSATPIPRTLYLALTGARSLSVIETPPAERRPIQTVVKAWDEKLVVEVVRRELRRGGQVYYLHNRVATIDAVASRLRELMPEVSFGVGHGQMHERDLERTMLDFVDGRFQVLVCTSIIESGLDIPNCNTIVIEGADRFGLSQLYQLRGRVGRFRHQAYAYLLLHRHSRLLDLARKRLNAIRHHNQLGAGFRIAMRDLELRGAGNLLGAEQSGHVVGVGFDLYCQLLRQSIARLKGEPAARAIRAVVNLDFVLSGEQREGGAGREGAHEDGYTALRDAERTADIVCPPVEARIPAAYVPELALRVDLYRRLAMAESAGAVRAIAAGVDDRFGKPPTPVRALLAATEIRCLAEQKGIASVETEGNRLVLRRLGSRHDDYVMLGARFPRLTGRSALSRLREISTFLSTLPDG